MCIRDRPYVPSVCPDTISKLLVLSTQPDSTTDVYVASEPTNTEFNSNASGTPQRQGPDVPPALLSTSTAISVVSITFCLPASLESKTG